MIRRPLRSLVALVVVAGLAMAAMPLVCRSQATAPVDCTRRPLDPIAPGTKVADRAPEGWSHLIFKTRSKLDAGDVNAIPEFARPASEFLFTVLAVRVVPQGPDGAGPWRLDKVGMGAGARIGTDDVVISTETQKQLGADLGILKLAILGRAEDHIKKIQQVAASPTMAVVDAPTYLLVENRHQPIVLRYLFLVKPENGGLATLAWRIDLDAKGKYLQAHGPATLVQPNLVATTSLHVDGNKVSVGIPAADAIAATRLPPGREVAIPPKAAEIAGRQQLSEVMAAELELQFRQALAQPPRS